VDSITTAAACALPLAAFGFILRTLAVFGRTLWAEG